LSKLYLENTFSRVQIFKKFTSENIRDLSPN